MHTRPFLLHALSPLHAGTGQAIDIIDLPIARMRSTGIPIVPGSSVKGVLRDARREDSAAPGARTLSEDELAAIFGPENASDHAGALIASEARLLLMPVRAFRGTFAWLTSPLLLTLASRDLSGLKGVPASIPQFDARGAQTTSNTIVLHDRTLYVEDLDLQATRETDATGPVSLWAGFLSGVLFPGSAAPNVSYREMLLRRFAVVDDETMAFIWETATQVDTRVRIDAKTRTAADKMLRSEESLPSETVLVGVFAATRSLRESRPLTAQQVLDRALVSEEILQFGGRATVGHGRCRLVAA